MPINKKYQVKIYDTDGTTYITTFNQDEIRNDISFKSQINFGQGQLSIVLNRPYDDFGEGEDIDILNIVKVFESDSGNVDPRLIYTGFISQYNPFTKKDDEGVTVVCLGLLSLLTFIPYRSGGSLEFNKNDSPENIIDDIISNFSSDYPGLITTNLSATGVNSDIDFSKQDSLSAVQSVFSTIGQDFYFFLDQFGVLNLEQKQAQSDHVFTIGKDIDFVTTVKSSEEIINFATLFYDVGNETASDASSISINGKHEKIYTDTNIKDSVTAQNFVGQKIEQNKDRKINSIIRINSEFNIEDVNPGDTCKILNIKETQKTFVDDMQIVSVNYQADFIIIELSEFRLNFGAELEKFIS